MVSLSDIHPTENGHMLSTDLLTMSKQELDRLTVVERIIERRLTLVEGGKQLGITTRQMRDWLKRSERMAHKAWYPRNAESEVIAPILTNSSGW